jgi:cbb3-type cytochrome oxidase subunit 1
MTVLVGLVVVLGGTSMMQGMQDEQASTLFAGTARDALGSWWIGQDIIGCTLPNGQCPSGK